jgi:hypothetical protein
LTVISSYDNEDAAIAAFDSDPSEDDDVDPIFT